MELVTLMYHSIYSTDLEYADIADEDRPYAIHRDVFEEHLKWMSDQSMNVIDPNLMFEDLSNSDINILITFDDGHIGFYLYAFPLLCQFGFKGIFFITTDFIGKKKEFCNWDQLDEMSKSDMHIQSHGVTHKFIEDMSAEDAFFELKLSKAEIEKHTDSHVWSISFPGGRFNSASLEIGKELGYTHFFTSESSKTKFPLLESVKIGRFAIKSFSRVSDIADFINPTFMQKYKFIMASIMKFMLKKILGNYGYHKLYKALNKSGKV